MGRTEASTPTEVHLAVRRGGAEPLPRATGGVEPRPYGSGSGNEINGAAGMRKGGLFRGLSRDRPLYFDYFILQLCDHGDDHGAALGVLIQVAAHGLSLIHI